MSDVKTMMNSIINEMNVDKESGMARFLQANPYTCFPFYSYNGLITSDLFEKTLYCESEESETYKNYLCDILKSTHGKNTFFIVGYQGCGKTTFINSVINKYKKNAETQTLIIDCDKRGIGSNFSKVKAIFSQQLKDDVDNGDNTCNFLDFFYDNIQIIKRFVNANSLIGFYNKLKKINMYSEDSKRADGINKYLQIANYIENRLDFNDVFYLLAMWYLSINYNNAYKINEKLLIFIDNLDYVDIYNDLATFITSLDAFTIDFSGNFFGFKLCKNSERRFQYTDKIKLFVAMRETTKANLPPSHFSDAFQSIYKSYDVTEWYDKGKIIKKRVQQIEQYDDNKILRAEIQDRMQIMCRIASDTYTKNVIYPLFNNNYRSTIDMLSKIVVDHYDALKTYNDIMNISDTTFRHGARGILFKLIFDEFNKSDGNDESCFKKIGVLDLLNRKNNEVSICRVLLSYLSNYTETKCDSARNSVKLSDVIAEFKGIFEYRDIMRILCKMFELRDTRWTHLVSFNQIEYKNNDIPQKALGKIDFKKLNPEETMIHYSCAGKIYIEYVTTHFEFFTSRVFKEAVEPLFCSSNIKKDKNTGRYVFCDIIDKIYSEVEQCCTSLKAFNKKVCSKNNFSDPYLESDLYRKSHYICQFKRKDFDSEDERRFKQFHEDRMINSHIVYIDKFRLYVTNHCENISNEEKTDINKKLVKCIKNYVNLLKSNNVLKIERTITELIPHYNKQIERIEKHLNNYTIEITYNK